ATGQVLFSLGTDTAGSGRVPAAFNNILGLKGTCGRVSNSGVVPACKSIDCLTVFARSTDDLSKVFAVMSDYDSSDPYARCAPVVKKGFKKNFVFGVPDTEDLQFFNDEEARKLFYKAVESLEKIGGTAKRINLRPFLDAAKLLYERSFVAERLSGNYDFFEKHLDKCLPVIQTIIGGSRKFTAADVFADRLKLSEYKKLSEEILEGIDFVVTPTTGTIYKIEDVLNDPIALNSNLGYYTNFMNLMDFCAVALPAGFRAEGEKKGLPFGITLFARAFHDEALLAVASEYTNFTSYPTGAKMLPYKTNEVKKSPECYTEVVVCGAHLKDMPLNYQLNDLEAEYVKTCSTSANYRMYLLDCTGAVKKPGLIRKDNSGCKFEVEIYRMSYEALGYFLSLIPYPLGLGKVELEDGSMLTGFICEGEAVTNARDISEYGSFRKFMKSEC
ncbi:MAG: allophanate hydrolase, partial [Succinivibrio sp.]